MTQQKVEVPTSLNDIPLHKFQQYLAIAEDASDNFKAKRILNLFCGITPREFNGIKHQDIENLIFKVANVLNSSPKFQETFTLKGVKYGIIPNLSESMSHGEFTHLDDIKDFPKDVDTLMSILYRPITHESGGRYEIEPYKGKYKFKEIPAGIAFGALVFFWTLGRDLLSATLKYTKETQTQTKLINGSGKNGAGKAQLLDYATETLQNSLKSLTQTTIPRYYGFAIPAIWLPYKGQK